MPVEGVEGFCPELEIHVLVNWDLLEQRHVKILKSRTTHLGRRSSERRAVVLADRGRDRGIAERTGIEPLRCVMRARVQVLAGNLVGKATKVCSGRYRATDRDWLSCLVRVDEVGGPTTCHCLRCGVRIAQQELSAPDWQGIGSRRVYHLRGVVAAQ